MLIAEELVLLALEPDGTLARGTLSHSTVDLGVTAALITELLERGHLELPEGRIKVASTRPSDPILAQAYASLEKHDGKKLEDRLGSIENAGWREVVDHMIGAGIIGRSKEGILPTRHPVTDPGAHSGLLREIRSAATGTGEMSSRIASLLALAGPSQLLEVVAPDRSDRKAAKLRIDEAAEHTAAAEALKHVVESMQATIAISTAVIAATT